MPEEMLARAFEVYLKSKLEEQGIRNDYLVNYRSEESWAKATASGFKMENTYPYPTATEVADIKMAFDYLFDSVRFKMHDKNCELYSATAENISELVKESTLLSAQELNSTQKAWQKMSEEVFGIDLKYFEGAPELHGRYDGVSIHAPLAECDRIKATFAVAQCPRVSIHAPLAECDSLRKEP